MASTQQKSRTLLTLVDYHHSVLREVMEPVQFPLSEQDKEIIEDMKYSIQPAQLKKANAPWDAAVGMAANQWGLNKRIFLFCPEGDTVNGLEVIINPSYEPLENTGSSPQELTWEGCFSVPLATGNVQRHTHIRVKYQNEAGETIERELYDWPARVWQHENDHLNGLLYDDAKAGKCIDKRQFSSRAEVDKFYDSKREAQGRTDPPCPCGTGKTFKKCCGVYLLQEKIPDNPEALMRSRYAAYVVENLDYIKKTMRGPALIQFVEQRALDKTSNKPVEWLGLQVVKAYYGSNPHVGYVEFIAKYKENNSMRTMHELSKFYYEEGQWYYVEGESLS